MVRGGPARAPGVSAAAVKARRPVAGSPRAPRTGWAALACVLALGLLTAPDAPGAACGFDRTLEYAAYSARVSTQPVDGACSLVSLRIELTVPGAGDSQGLLLPETDPAAGAWLEDLDGDGRPEVIVHTRAAGSGSYGGLIVVAWENGRIVRHRPPPLTGPDAVGYGGRDRFQIVDGRILRTFPIYRPGDANCCPQGGTRRMSYRLGSRGLRPVDEREP